MSIVEVRRVVEYSQFFPSERPIDVDETLRQFNRIELVKIAALISLQYGNLSFPNKYQTIFSEESRIHIPELNKLFEDYSRRVGLKLNESVEICTFRTGLELWRHIFSIPQESFTSEVANQDKEFLLFKVLLSLNEIVVGFKGEIDNLEADELLFLNSFLTNDTNIYDYQKVIQCQAYYFQQLIAFIPSNDLMKNASEQLFARWRIGHWNQYFATILWLCNETNRYKEDRGLGVPIINVDQLTANDTTKLFSPILVDSLSVDVNEYLPYEDDGDTDGRTLNVDYRRFREKPFVRIGDGNYIVINNQLLCERLYNSLYFDFLPFINGKSGSCGYFDYNKDFTEKVLFRNTFFNCLPSSVFTYPNRGGNVSNEQPHEPDFYARTAQSQLILVECKAIKMNGLCRDEGDYKRLLDELREKIVLKTRNLDKSRKEFNRAPEPIGVGQLAYNINSIEDDKFLWDDSIPDEVSYYPILVFDDIRFLQPGLLSLVNRWFYQELHSWEEIELSKVACNPVMIVSINTLYLYDDFIRKKGITRLIDSFLRNEAEYCANTGEYVFNNPMVSFDDYLRHNPYNKKQDVARWLKEFLHAPNS